MQSNLIEVENLIKNYLVGDRVIRILRKINFSIKAGEYVMLFGPSGSGKTTILNMIAGFDNPTSGRIVVDSEDITSSSLDNLAKYRLTKIGMVFQDFNLVPAMTAVDNVALPLIFSDISLKQRQKNAIRLLKEMGLGSRLNHKPIELSGGEQQRVAIARALVNNPSILLIDEPTGNLDGQSATEIMDIINNLNKQLGRTIVLVTHNPNYLSMAHRVLKIEDGRIQN